MQFLSYGGMNFLDKLWDLRYRPKCLPDYVCLKRLCLQISSLQCAADLNDRGRSKEDEDVVHNIRGAANLPCQIAASHHIAASAVTRALPTLPRNLPGELFPPLMLYCCTRAADNRGNSCPEISTGNTAVESPNTSAPAAAVTKSGARFYNYDYLAREARMIFSLLWACLPPPPWRRILSYLSCLF